MNFGRSRSPLSENGYYAGSINQNDIVIAVMGPTGVGKSSFVNDVAGRREAEIGNSLRSKTQIVQPVRCRHPDGHRDIILVDTPGFDDTHLSDSQILRIIANWMKKTYENKLKLSGLLYLHRITDDTMAGTPRRNLAVFKDLCGAENMKNVLLVTTMWDKVEDVSVGETREKQLISDFWQDMMSLGSRTCRFHRTSESAWEIIDRLDFKPPRPTLRQLKIQEEIDAGGLINQNDIVIAVMGLGGVGKSSFVNKVAGRSEVEVRDGLRPKTLSVQPVRCRHPNGHLDIVLVDTPGIDGTHLSDAQILRIIAVWMKKTYEDKIKLSGILYLHPISDVRMAGMPLRNLAVFKDLCGANNMKNVVLVTTMWDEVEDDVSVGERREKQLVSDFWQDMISLGSRTCRFYGTSESAWEIINRLDFKPPRPTLRPLRIQEEMVDHHLPFQNTTAAETLLRSLVADFKKVIKLVIGTRHAAIARKTLDNRPFRPLRRPLSINSLSAVSDSTNTASGFSSDSGYPYMALGASSGCHPNGRRNTLQTMVSGLRQVIPIADIISNTALRKLITTVLHIAQHIERMGGSGTHHAIGHVLEGSGWLLQGIVQCAAQCKLPKDMKKPLVSFQQSLIGLQNLVMNITRRNPAAPFFLQDEDIGVIKACITSIKEIYDKPNFKLSINNNYAIACLDNQLNVLHDNSILNKCECGISAVPEEE